MDPSVVLKIPKNLALTTEKNARASVYSLSQKKLLTECRWSPKILTKMKVVGPNFSMDMAWKRSISLSLSKRNDKNDTKMTEQKFNFSFS